MTSNADPTPPSADGKPLEIAGLNTAYRRPLMNYFLRHTGDAADAEDLTQEVFVRALRLDGDRAIHSPDTFVFTIASNLLRDRSRRRMARQADRHVSLDRGGQDDNPSPAVEIPAEDLSAERVLIDRERLRQALEALDKLPARTREIFILFRLEGMRQSEIAARLGISVSAVEKHVVRAVAHLARRFR